MGDPAYEEIESGEPIQICRTNGTRIACVLERVTVDTLFGKFRSVPLSDIESIERCELDGGKIAMNVVAVAVATGIVLWVISSFANADWSGGWHWSAP
jgi:hypothetical protein